MLTDEEHLVEVQTCHNKDDEQRAAAPDGQLLELAIDHGLQQAEQGGQQTCQQDEQPQRPAEECGGLGIAGVEHILDGGGVDDDAIGEDEIGGGGIDDGKDGQQDAAYYPGEEHQEIGHHEIEHQHDDHQRRQQEDLAACALVAVVGDVIKEGYVVEQQRGDADNTRECKEGKGFTQGLYQFFHLEYFYHRI